MNPQFVCLRPTRSRRKLLHPQTFGSSCCHSNGISAEVRSNCRITPTRFNSLRTVIANSHKQTTGRQKCFTRSSSILVTRSCPYDKSHDQPKCIDRLGALTILLASQLGDSAPNTTQIVLRARNFQG